VSAIRLVPPIGWTLLIFSLSMDRFGAPETGSFLLPWLHSLLPWASPAQLEAAHWVVRKCAHLTEYGVLAALWRLGLGLSARRGFWVPLALAFTTGAIDEIHQVFTISRGASVWDVLLDTAGAALALTFLAGRAGILIERLTGVLLLVAAAGGAAMIALDWSAGVPAGWLWWTMPVAWVALILWLRWRVS